MGFHVVLLGSMLAHLLRVMAHKLYGEVSLGFAGTPAATEIRAAIVQQHMTGVCHGRRKTIQRTGGRIMAASRNDAEIHTRRRPEAGSALRGNAKK
jgi:hypothetical protein